MDITKTASGTVSFETIYFNKPISEWVTIINKKIAKPNEFRVIKIHPGKFGYDVLATMINHTFTCINENINDILLYTRNRLDIQPYLNLIHGSYVECYLFWKNFSPHINNGYTVPKKELITDFNNDRVTTYCEKLDVNIIQMYTAILEIIFDLVSEIVLSEGIKQINM